MKTKALVAACAALAFGGMAHAAGMTLYGQPDFSGPSVNVRDGMPRLADSGFQDQASSARIDSGRWEICTQPDFRGDCMVLGPGDYNRLDNRIFHRAESVRPVAERDWRGRGGYAMRDDYGDYRRGGTIELFAHRDFRGHLLTLDHDSKRLDMGGGISSLVVNDGVWELCSQAHFDGRCRTYRPGRYAEIDRYHDHIESIRRIG